MIADCARVHPLQPAEGARFTWLAGARLAREHLETARPAGFRARQIQREPLGRERALDSAQVEMRESVARCAGVAFIILATRIRSAPPLSISNVREPLKRLADSDKGDKSPLKAQS